MQQERESEQSATETQFDRLSSEHGEIRALAAELRAVLGRRAAAGSASDPELAVLLETFAARLGAHFEFEESGGLFDGGADPAPVSYTHLTLPTIYSV